MNTAFVEWVDDGTGRVPIFFDRQRRLVDVMHDYICQIAATSRLGASPRGYASTVDAATYALLSWLRHLDTQNRHWQQADDALLEQYRDSELDAVQVSMQSKSDERIAKRTVNVKVQHIYRFYCWAQKVKQCKGLIGPSRPIVSTLTNQKPLGGRGSRKKDLELYPLCYKGVSGSSGGPQYFATSKDKQGMLELFAKASDPFLAERNRLMLELTDRVGWRAGTVTGLLINDFNAEIIQSAEEEGVIVTPKVQKFGYRNSFVVPHSLFARVVRFKVMRSRWLSHRGWGESLAQRYLFVSSRTGRPLGHQTLVHVIGDAFRALGVTANRGAGHHSFRRKFADESTKDDLQARKLSGHSTAVEDVLHATAMRLGQRRLASQAPYQRAVRNGTLDAEPHRLRRQVQELEATVADKDMIIAQLRHELDAKRKRLHHRARKNFAK